MLLIQWSEIFCRPCCYRFLGDWNIQGPLDGIEICLMYTATDVYIAWCIRLVIQSESLHFYVSYNIRAYVWFMLFVIACAQLTQHALVIWVTLRMSYKRQERFTLTISWVHQRFVVGSVPLILLVFCVVSYFLCIVCLRPVHCVANVVSVSGLSIFYWPFGFLWICPFLIAPSVLSSVYIHYTSVVTLLFQDNASCVLN